MADRGMLIVLSGPSGVGKDTLMRNAMKYDSNLKQSVSVTTRAPRTGEREGVNYYFISHEKYAEMRDRGEFLEYQEVHGNSYATPKKYVDKIRDDGYDAVLVIDVKGGLAVRERQPDAHLIFVLPESLHTLYSRLTGRDTDEKTVIARRMAAAPSEIEKALNYDYVVVNSDLERCTDDLLTVLDAIKSGDPDKMTDIYRYSVENNKELIQKLIDGGNDL